MKRLFAAIKIHPSPRYISLFNEISSSLRHERIKWVEPENTHLSIFGSRYDPKVIWFGIEKNSVLEDLVQNIFTELTKCGWEKDRQNFVPHLTIGRIKELNDKPLFQKIVSKYNTVEIQDENVTEIILYESILRREGPLYVNVFSAKL